MRYLTAGCTLVLVALASLAVVTGRPPSEAAEVTVAPIATVTGRATTPFWSAAPIVATPGSPAASPAPPGTVAAVPATSTTTAAAPVQVVVVGPVRTDGGTSWWESPVVTGLVGLVLGGLLSWLLARSERAHSRSIRQQEKAEVRAAGRMTRFENQLAAVRGKALAASETARSLAVLAAVLSPQNPPGTDIADLPIDPTAFDDQLLAEGLDVVLVQLGEYRVRPDADRRQAVQQLVDAVDAIKDDVKADAESQLRTLRQLADQGRKDAQADAELIAGTTK